MYAKYSGWLKRQRTRPRVNRVYIVPGHTYETWKLTLIIDHIYVQDNTM